MKRLCPICRHSKNLLLYRQNFNNKVIALMDSYDVVVCGRCGFAYADNIPPKDEFDDYYARMSKYEFDYQGGVVTDEYVNYFSKIVDFLVPHLDNKNIRILDIGCSTGGLLSVFKSRGYQNLVGIDPSSECVRIAKEFYEIDAVVGTIANFNPVERFDLIILSAVLEHLADFGDSMNKISALLKDQGMLFIEVPDVERFTTYIFAPFQQFSTEHINYFSRYSLENLLAGFSFKTIAMRQYDHTLNMTTDPDIFSLSRKNLPDDYKIVHDSVSESSIRDYIKQCVEIDSHIKRIISTELSGQGKIIVWGVGTHTQRLLGSGLDISKILFFVDSNKKYTGKKINGVEIKSPNDVKENIPILVSTHSYQNEISHQIREVLKLKNKIITLY